MPYELCLDVSHYQQNLDYKLIASKGVKAIIVKASQGSQLIDSMVRVHAYGAREAGMAVGLYHWVDPIYDGNTQANVFKKLIDELQPQFVAGDVEQWWADWTKWGMWRRREIPYEDVPLLSSKQIERVTRDFFINLKGQINIPLLFYTSTGYIKNYKNLITFAKDYPLWLAQYIDPRKRTNTTWEDLPGYYPSETNIGLAKNMNWPLIWQWSGDVFFLPGHDGALDLNFLMKPLAEWASGNPGPIDRPYQVRRLATDVSGLNVRETPGDLKSRIFRVIQPTETIYVEKNLVEQDVWLKLYQEPGWIHGGYTISAE